LNINDLDINEQDDKKWTGMMYAVINNHIEVVKLLLEKEATLPKQIKEEEKLTDDNRDPFVKPLDSSSYGKYTPIHWAAYKSNILIASLLLKYNHDPLQIDTGGNSALQQAAASNNLEIFKLFMGLGLDLEMKNSRNHSAIDLTSNEDIRKLIQNALSIKLCQICSKMFSFHNKRYLCYVNEEIVCKDCCSSGFYYSDLQASEKNVLERRCNNCSKTINQAEAELNHAIRDGDLNDLREVFNYINTEKIKICVKLRQDAVLNIERLERENKIKDHINGLKVVSDHKIIEKSVYVLDQMLKEAQERNINLEVEVIQNAYLEKNRLLAERDLRKLLSNLTIDQSSPENLQELIEKLTNAQLCKVSDEYCSVAVDLSKKIQVNLCAKDLLATFCAYPIREYPPPEETDPKKSIL
jgi:ankyrin repeat protein